MCEALKSLRLFPKCQQAENPSKVRRKKFRFRGRNVSRERSRESRTETLDGASRVKEPRGVNSHRESLQTTGTLTSRQVMQVKPGEMSTRRWQQRRFLSAEAFSTALRWHSQGRPGRLSTESGGLERRGGGRWSVKLVE